METSPSRLGDVGRSPTADMNASDHAAELRQLAERYRALSESGLGADEFNASLRRDGVSALNAVVMLRDLYGLAFRDCMAIHKRYLATTELSDDDAAT